MEHRPRQKFPGILGIPDERTNAKRIGDFT
jgi:hypothetical protein